jgi:hypothetical protein
MAAYSWEVALTGFFAIGVIAAIASFSSHYYGLIQARLDIEKAWAKLNDVLKRRRAALDELLEAAKFDDRFQPGVVSDAKRLLMTMPGDGRAEAVRFDGELRLSTAIGKVLATSQNYPTLARDPRYRKLEETILDIEEEVARRRELYNAQVEINNAHYSNVFERFIASLADVDLWEPFPNSETEESEEAELRDASRPSAALELPAITEIDEIDDDPNRPDLLSAAPVAEPPVAPVVAKAPVAPILVTAPVAPVAGAPAVSLVTKIPAGSKVPEIPAAAKVPNVPAAAMNGGAKAPEAARVPGPAEFERYVSTSDKRPAARAITTSIAMRSPTEISRPQR